MSKVIPIGNGGVRSEQTIPSRGTLCLDKSNPPFVSVGLSQPARGVGKASVRSTFRQQIDRLRWRKQRNRFVAYFARACGYVTPEQHTELTALCAEIGKMLGAMINNPAPFLISDR